jgi:eukaryotic-like serine/threonine-protein kinase
MTGRKVKAERIADRGRLLSEACAPGACDAVGDVVDGRYLLERRAGSGAAGTVWVALDLTRGIEVAVKLLRASQIGKEDVADLLAREAELASRMLSPHIVKVLASGESAAHGRYVVYELLEGEDLARVLERKRRLAIVDTRRVVVHACRGLARAHALGVVHRDIKPSNLFMTDDGAGGDPVLKVLDFGLAEHAGRAERDPSKVVGTLEYIAPEVLFGEAEPDVRSDLFGLAVVAYECFTGRVPYEAGSIEQLVVAYASKTPAPPSTIRPGLPREVDAWFDRALARDPSERFSSAKEMADALDEALESIDRAVPRTMSGLHVRAAKP